MTTLLSVVGRKAASSSRLAVLSFGAFYSTATGLAALRNWGVSVPAPVSLVSDHVESEPVKKERSSKSLPRKPTPSQYKTHRERIKEQFPEGWSPPRKISRQAMDGMRVMQAQNPEIFTTSVLAEQFKISPEAVRRILKSKWEPSREQRARLLQREARERRERIERRRIEETKAQLVVQRQQDMARRRQEDKLTLT
jgi:hypothetical protein